VQIRDLEKIMGAIGGFLEEGNAETRAHGKRAAVAIAKIVNNQAEFELLLRKHLTELQIQKIIEIVRQQQHLKPASKQTFQPPKHQLKKKDGISTPSHGKMVEESPKSAMLRPQTTKNKPSPPRKPAAEELDVTGLLTNMAAGGNNANAFLIF
jgi:hypothetical protein